MKALFLLLAAALLTGCGLNPDYMRNVFANADMRTLRMTEENPFAPQMQRDLAKAEIRKRLVGEVKSGKLSPSVAEDIEERHVRIGMSKEDVMRSWGTPTRLNRSLSAAGETEQWVYEGYRFRTQYVHFVDGRVSYISTLGG